MIGECFDPTAELAISQHYRPHWSQAGAIVFITMRAADSIPAEVLQRWDREKSEWLRHQGFEGERWRDVLPTIDPHTKKKFAQHFNRTREDFLDGGRGACLLRSPDLAKIVGDSLLFFDKDRYRMGDFVVMPNHVHFLVAFPTEDAMQQQCTSWMRFTARRINETVGRKGEFWQAEPFDHLVRSPEQYDYLRRYIFNNPLKAKLKSGEFLYHSDGE